MVHSQTSHIVLVDALLDAVLLPDFSHQPLQNLLGLTVEIFPVDLIALTGFVYNFEGLHQRPLNVLYSKSAVSDVVRAVQWVQHNKRVLKGA